jgi:DNA-binding transcriptional MerR regulator
VSENYIISDAAKMLDIEPHVLRYWEDELELVIPRNQLGHRYYSKEDLDVLKRIKLLKEKGLQLKAIKLLLEIPQDDNENSIDIKERDELSTINADVNLHNDKLKQFQEFMKVILQTSLKENNEVLANEIKDLVVSDMKNIYQESEEKAESRYKKLDKTIREMQKMRQEIAVSKNSKKKFFFKKK